jgi:hypothetical protein
MEKRARQSVPRPSPESEAFNLRASVPEQARPEQPREQPVQVLRPEPERVRQPGPELVRQPVPGSAQPPERARVLRQQERQQEPELPWLARLPVGGPEHRRELRPQPPEE